MEATIFEKTPWNTVEVSYIGADMQKLLHYKKLAKEQAANTIDWSKLPKEITHLVFYSELRDPKERIYFANIYLGGAADACDDEKFKRLYTEKPRQYTIAVHRR